jgi:uncharacterized membrane protein
MTSIAQFWQILGLIKTARLIRFLTYNLFFALLPLIISIVLRLLRNIVVPGGAYASELLFFGIMISATVMGDMTDEIKLIGGDAKFELMRSIMMYGAVFSAILYGSYFYDSISPNGNSIFQSNVSTLSIFLAIMLFSAGTSIELLIVKIQKVNP